MGLHDWQLEFQLNFTTLNYGTSRLFTGKPLEKLLAYMHSFRLHGNEFSLRW